MSSFDCTGVVNVIKTPVDIGHSIYPFAVHPPGSGRYQSSNNSSKANNLPNRSKGYQYKAFPFPKDTTSRIFAPKSLKIQILISS